MTLRRSSCARKVGRLVLAATVSVSLAVADLVLSAPWSAPASAKGGNNAGGNSGGNSGDNGGGSNAGGNSAGHSNAGGNGKGKGASAAGAGSATAAPDTALELRTTGQIKPLAELYEVVEQQFGGEVVDAKLVGDETSGWTYDVRVVTEDGHLRDVTYGAADLAVISIDGQPIE